MPEFLDKLERERQDYQDEATKLEAEIIGGITPKELRSVHITKKNLLNALASNLESEIKIHERVLASEQTSARLN